MSARKILAAAVLGGVTLAGVGLVIEQASHSHAVATDPHGTALPAERQVRISRTMPAPSAPDGLAVRLVRGTMPTAVVEATVLTDSECTPDAHGLSHCLNRLRLPNGDEIQVRHTHDMRLVPCLAPGEHVRLVPAPL